MNPNDESRLAEHRHAFLRLLPRRVETIGRRLLRFLQNGWDINGQICSYQTSDGKLRLITGEDTGQPEVLPGWGIFDVTGSPGSLQVNTLPLRIGGDSYPGEFFAGLIDNLRIYNRALTAAEVQQDMATPVGGSGPPDTTPPVLSGGSPSGELPAGTTQATYGGASDIWDAQWTAAQIGDPAFGVALQVRASPGAAEPRARVEAVRLDVHYCE